MHNSYPQFDIRTVRPLDGVWDLAVLGDVDPDSVDVSDLSYPHQMAVPGIYDVLPEFAGMRGLVAVRTRVRVTPDQRGRLRFGGLGLWARVIVDGVALDDCHLPYCPWSVEVPASSATEREVVLLIDNRFGEERARLFDPYFDWYAHGGIYRSVTWHELPELAIDRATVTTTDVASGAVNVAVRFDGPVGDTVDLTLTWDQGDALAHGTVAVTDGVATVATTVPHAQPWSPASPHLHCVRVALADGTDSIIERTGLRTLATNQGSILLNGEPVVIKGVNRHEYATLSGPALTDADIVHDLALLRDLGVNVVRGSHYQQDQRFLDRCDELGLLVWENHSVGRPATAILPTPASPISRKNSCGG